mgnify:CR=1 FL=1
MKKTYILVILDGWGIGEANESNPIYIAAPQNIELIEKNFPVAALQASGIAVGLPWDEEGNSEVGHLTIGAGKIIYQHYPRISLAIRDGSFFENEALKAAFNHARLHQSAVHLIGLLTQGNVHASFEHLIALLEMAKKENQEKVYLHLFSDGRDSPPKSALELLKKLKEEIEKIKIGTIVSLAGRYYGMNRQENWDRTERAYQAITGQGEEIQNLEEEIEKIYEKGLNDEFIPPLIIDKTKTVKDNDSIIFFNFREDRARQIVKPFVEPNFKHFPVKNFRNLYVTTMTCYQENLKTAVAFPPQKIENPLGKVLADNQKTQLRIAETEKYAHITYFFNGLREQPFLNEYRILIPSQNIINPAENPAMMAEAITDRAITALNESSFDFILINFANPDIIAHTGDYQATIQAIKIVDQQIGRLLKSVLTQNHVLIITADHGNAESLINLKTGQAETKHNMSPVPIYLIANEFKRKKTNSETKKYETIGLLSDIAPTILDLMQIPKPPEMTGQSLLPLLL